MAAAAHHIALTCKDPLQVERFYTKHFGFKRARVIDLGSDQIVFIKLGGLYLEIFRASAEALTNQPKEEASVTVVISWHIKPGREADFEAWVAGICAAGAQFPGHLGATILRPAGPQAEYVLIFRFDTQAHLQAWEDSTVRDAWVERVKDMTVVQPSVRMLGGPPPEKDGFQWPGWRHIALKVDSVDATLAAMGAEANVKLGPMNFDSFIKGWRSAWLADPEGNIIEISQGYADQESPPPLS